MPYQLYSIASFGGSKAGLATVGYQLVNADASLSGTRVTAGVQEIGGGQYGALVTYPDTFSGRLTWDTGETVPLLVSDSVNPDSMAGGLTATNTAIAAVQTTVTAIQTAVGGVQTGVTALGTAVTGLVTQLAALPAAGWAYLKGLLP